MSEGKAVYFIDIDGIIVNQHDINTPNYIRKDAVEKLKKLSAAGNDLWLFSCWAFTPEAINFLMGLGVPFRGFINKPYAQKYAYIDDCLDVSLCDNKL